MEIDFIYKAPESSWLSDMWQHTGHAYSLEVWFVHEDDVRHGFVVGMGSKLMGELADGGRFENIPRHEVVAARLRVRSDWTVLEQCVHDGCRKMLFRNDTGDQVDEHNLVCGSDGHQHTLQRPRHKNGDPAGQCKGCGLELFHNSKGGITDTWNGLYCNDGPGREGRTRLHAAR